MWMLLKVRVIPHCSDSIWDSHYLRNATPIGLDWSTIFLSVLLVWGGIADGYFSRLYLSMAKWWGIFRLKMFCTLHQQIEKLSATQHIRGTPRRRGPVHVAIWFLVTVLPTQAMHATMLTNTTGCTGMSADCLGVERMTEFLFYFPRLVMKA